MKESSLQQAGTFGGLQEKVQPGEILRAIFFSFSKIFVDNVFIIQNITIQVIYYTEKFQQAMRPVWERPRALEKI